MMARYRQLVQVIVFVVVAVFALGIQTTGGTVDAGWLKFGSAAVAVGCGVLFAVDQWLWRLGVAQRIERVPPLVRGTWKGTLTSLWVDPATGARPAPKTVYLVIRQTATTVSAVLLTDDARSDSTLGKVTRKDGAASLDYLYRSDPQLSKAPGNPIHKGAASLAITGAPGTTLRGSYWTSRASTGELHFKEHSSKLAGDYTQALDLLP